MLLSLSRSTTRSMVGLSGRKVARQASNPTASQMPIQLPTRLGPIMEALNLVGGWIGIRKAVGLEAWRATFRPDIPTIDRVVELR